MSASASSLSARTALVGELQRVRRLHDERKSNPFLAGALERLERWQARRLRMTYADLAQSPAHSAAIAFFQTDLYGGGDFSQRDADLARVVPIMVKMLPGRVIATAAKAMALNAMSQELDRLVLARLPRADGHFTVAEYCRAYRRAGNFAARRRQIEMIVEVGTAIDGYVKKPLIRGALAMMRKPAQMAGMGALQDFLERGFAAFHRMDGATEFLATIAARESAIHEAIEAGAREPFPDPLGPELARTA
jgi:hypothetical protein